jgi:FlaA1/EpsC-like NDP-sugar epimerase
LPLLERHPCEGVKSNVLGTHHLVEAAVKHDTERFVLISTDKAASPHSVLGATKRLAEMIVQAQSMGPTAFCSVRFGNVLGSRGSLLNVVADQLAHGEAVTVTHPDVTRFFMTVEEAVGLVLAAVPMTKGGETFVLDMGEPVKVVDLVHAYAEQMHVSDVSIRFTGLRPGEKLHEELFADCEERLKTAHPAVWATKDFEVPRDFAAHLRLLYAAAAKEDGSTVRYLLQQMVPAYVPAATDPSELAAALRAPYPDDF